MNTYKGLLSRRDFLAAGAATLAGTSLLSLAGCAGSNILEQGDAYVLDVGYQEYMIDGLRVRTRTFGSLPGPTLITAPGRKLKITMNNHLPPNPPAGDGGMPGDGHMSPTRGAMPQNPNDPHDFNTTNLHVHGLQVRPHLFAPFGTSDPASEMIAIKPGESFTYDFELPDDHPSGLHWYHPHHHGSTAIQVYNGMAGAIICRGPIDEVPEIKAAREQIIAIQMLRISPSAADPTLWVNDPIANEPANEGGFTDNQLRNYYLVNGNPAAWIGPENNPPTNQLAVESLYMKPGEVLRFRVLNGGDGQLMPLQLEGHELHVIGYDGVNLEHPDTMVETVLPAGGRSEFLVKAGDPGTYRLFMAPVVGQQNSDSQGFQIMNVVVSGTPVDMALPTSLPIPHREYPMISEADCAGRGQSLHFSVTFPYPELLTGVAFPINGKLYDHARIDHTVQRGTCEEWLLTASDDEGHPFHLHVNSFWVIEVNGVPLEKPEVRDVVWIPKGGSVKIRIRHLTWVGKSVYHCHFLFHEDTGMMQNFMIVP